MAKKATSTTNTTTSKKGLDIFSQPLMNTAKQVGKPKKKKKKKKAPVQAQPPEQSTLSVTPAPIPMTASEANTVLGTVGTDGVTQTPPTPTGLAATLATLADIHPPISFEPIKKLPPAQFFTTYNQLRKKNNGPRNEQLKKKFLDGFGLCGYVSEAALYTGVPRRAHYWWMETDKDYADTFLELKEEVEARIKEESEKELHRRAVEGVEEPVFGNLGMNLGSGIVGKVRKYSDTLLMFKLKAVDPKYRDNQPGQQGGGGNAVVAIKIVYEDKQAGTIEERPTRPAISASAKVD